MVRPGVNRRAVFKNSAVGHHFHIPAVKLNNLGQDGGDVALPRRRDGFLDRLETGESLRSTRSTSMSLTPVSGQGLKSITVEASAGIVFMLVSLLSSLITLIPESTVYSTQWTISSSFALSRSKLLRGNEGSG